MRFYERSDVILAVALLLRLAVAVIMTGRFYAGEVNQTLEIAYYLIYPERETGIPYEFQTQLRSYLWPITFLPLLWAMLQLPLSGLQLFAAMRVAMSVFSLIPLWLLMRLDLSLSPRSTLLLKWFIASCPPLIYFSLLLSADGLSLTLILIFLILYLHQSRSKALLMYTLAGFIIALRLNMGLFFLPLLLSKLRQEREELATAVAGLFAGFLPLFIIDWIFYGNPLVSTIRFVEFNIVSNSSTEFGVQPWWFLLALGSALFLGGGLLLPIAGSILISAREELDRYRLYPILATGIVLMIIVHSIIPHKEIRFLISPFIVLLFIIVVLEHVVSWESRRWRMLLVSGLTVMFIVGLAMPYHPYGNLWQAQQYVADQDNEASLVIHDYGSKVGGMVLQCAGNEVCGQLSYVRGFSTDALMTVLQGQSANYFILTPSYEDYELLLATIQDYCSVELMTSFEYHHPLAVNDLLLQIYQTHLREVWTCS